MRVRTFTEQPEDLVAYGALYDEHGQSFQIEVRGPHKAGVLAAIHGIEDREAALRLRGQRLYVPREVLPAPEDDDEFYYTDLIGLSVRTGDDVEVGVVKAVHDFGAGDLLEVAPSDGGRTVMLPFTREIVPVIDLDGGHLVIEPPSGWLDEAASDPEGTRQEP